MNGGAERLLVDVISRTSAVGFKHSVCVLRDPGVYGKEIVDSGHQLFSLALTGKRPWFVAARRIARISKETRADLLVSWLFDASISARLSILNGNRLPLLTTLHSTDYDPRTIEAGKWPPAKVEIRRQIDRITMRLTNPHFVACSNSVAESYKLRLGVAQQRVSVIHNFVDSSEFDPTLEANEQLRESMKIPQGAFLFVNVGRLDVQKGQAKLIKAFSSIATFAKDACLLIVGDGPEEATLRELARDLRLEDRVILAGRRDDIAACLSAADVFVFPSLVEGFGIALIEAMIMRVPCITSNLAVFDEIVEDEVSALLVRDTSESALADQMKRIYLDSSLRASIAMGGYNRAKNQFSSEVIVPKWNKLFLEVSR